jgi:hypothetical protein
MSEPAVMELLRAIAADDTVNAERMLRESPDLVTAHVQLGATRQRPAEYWLVEIEHYLYAGDTALHIAAASHRPPIVRTLLSLGADATAVNRRRAQPLHYAADGIPGSASWRPKQQAMVITLLINAGADPNASDVNGASPLHRAVRNRCAEAVQALLEGGADPSRPNKYGSAPMKLATHATGRGGSGNLPAKEQQTEIVRLLEQELRLAPHR